MDILTRNDAITSGDLFYFTGKPCNKGHMSHRYVSTFQCVECSKDHKRKSIADGKDKKYYESNKSSILLKSKEYRLKNKNSIAEKKKQYAEKNKDVIREYKKKYHVDNREKILEKVKTYCENNKDKVQQKSHEYRLRTKEKKAEYDRWFSSVNKDYRNSLKTANRAKRIKRWVEWDTELTDLVCKEAYDLCDRLQLLTNHRWHVDHVVPLCGKKVSGLHVWNNIAVIPASVNLSKNNKFIVE